jgi:hypothetical protein
VPTLRRPKLHVVLNEAVVRRQVGGAAVTAAQIRYLLDVSARDHVTIQVLPFSAGAHPGMKTGFTLMRFAEGFADMDCVYLENNLIQLARDQAIGQHMGSDVFSWRKSSSSGQTGDCVDLGSLITFVKNR